MFQRVKTAVLAGAAALGACSPALHWREVRVDAGGLKAVFPCKPDRQTRQISLAGRGGDAVRATLFHPRGALELIYTSEPTPELADPFFGGISFE